jgi:hypothetical protein
VFCRHNYRYTQGHFYCTKCGARSRGRANGILAFNQENLEKSIQRIPEGIPIEIAERANLSTDAPKSDGFIETIPNRIRVGHGNSGSIYGEFTPQNLKVIEHPRYNEIRFSIKAAIMDFGYDESVFLEIPATFLIGENSKKYPINVRDCVDLSNFNYMIEGRLTDTKLFDVCFDVDKGVKTFDVWFKGPSYVGNPNNTAKIGIIHVNN